jgi:hypothetical protein
MAKEYLLSETELIQLHKDASVSNAIKELADILIGRSNDLPHRFKAPKAFAQYMMDWGVNTTQRSIINIYGSNISCPMTMDMTTRPTQKIFEIIFQGADGTRLFTLEIEYGGSDAL